MRFMDIAHKDDGLLVTEGVNMGGKVLQKMADDSSVIVGFECEFKIHDDVLDTLKSQTWFDENRIDFEYISYEEIVDHPNWDATKFKHEYDDWYSMTADELHSQMWDDYTADAHWELVEKYKDKYRAEGEKWWEKEGKNQSHHSGPTGSDPKEQYIKDVISEIINDDHEEEQEELAFKAWEAYTEGELKGFGKLSKNTFFSLAKEFLCQRMSIDYGAEPEDGGEVSLGQLKALGAKFTEEYGHKFLDIQVGHNASQKDKHSWSLETDPSIDNHPEVISPAAKISITLDNMKDMLEFVSKYGYTDDKCGLHVSVNIDGKEAADYDLLKLGLFLGEDYILNKFGREGNQYSQSQIEAIRNAAKYHDSFLTPHEMMKITSGDAEGAVRSDPDGASLKDATVAALAKAYKQTEKAIFSDPMFTTRYRTFNISNLKDKGYIEFRVMGGENYHEKYDEIRKTMLRYAYVMKLCTDPDMEKKEYQKKLFKLFSEISKQERKPAANSRSAKARAKKAFQKIWVDVEYPVPMKDGYETPETTVNYGIRDQFLKMLSGDKITQENKDLTVAFMLGIYELHTEHDVDIKKYTPLLVQLRDVVLDKNIGDFMASAKKTGDYQGKREVGHGDKVMDVKVFAQEAARVLWRLK